MRNKEEGLKLINIDREELDMNRSSKYEFTINELHALYSLLHKEWISYENLAAIKVVHKIRMIVENDEQ